MKKILSVLLAVFVLSSCSQDLSQTDNKDYRGGVWISYYELNTMLGSEDGFKSEFSKVIENCKLMRIKNLYIHTRAFGETLYKSDYFPTVANVEAYDFDVFDYILKECRKAGLSVHAWINPYRISSQTDVDKLHKESPAYRWLKDDDPENDTNIGFSNGIYLNPASNKVRALVLDGIRELMAKYDIDGIHIDDYFYPTQATDFDKESYDKYKKSTDNPLSLDGWRCENVNILISSCYSTIKYANKDVIFSISPAANIEHNLKNLYADVSLWIKKGWMDEIIPQIYFGFEYPDNNFCFENLLSEWKSLAKQNENVKLKVGLASYKAVPTLEADMAEWETDYDIIARQVEICDNDSKISGYVYFSYSSLFGESQAYKAQRENILKYLKTGEKNE